MRKKILSLIAILLLASCGSSQPAGRTTSNAISSFDDNQSSSSSSASAPLPSSSSSSGPKPFVINGSPVRSLDQYVRENGRFYETTYDTWSDDWGLWDRDRKAGNADMKVGNFTLTHHSAYDAYDKHGMNTGRPDSLVVTSPSYMLTATVDFRGGQPLKIKITSELIAVVTQVYVDMFRGDEFQGGYYEYADKSNKNDMARLLNEEIPSFFRALNSDLRNRFSAALFTDADFNKQLDEPRWSTDIPFGKTARDMAPHVKATIYVEGEERNYGHYTFSTEPQNTYHPLPKSGESIEVEFVEGETISFHGGSLPGVSNYYTNHSREYEIIKDESYRLNVENASFTRIPTTDEAAHLLADYIRKNGQNKKITGTVCPEGYMSTLAISVSLALGANDFTYTIQASLGAIRYEKCTESTTIDIEFTYGAFKDSYGKMTVGTHYSWQSYDSRYYFYIKWGDFSSCPRVSYTVSGPSGGLYGASDRKPDLKSATYYCDFYMPDILKFAQGVCQAADPSLSLW